jgi:septal ring factor EnvC (AmiA/AmiB activator)
MSEQLQINIGADTKALETGLQRAVDAIDNFDKEVKDASGELRQFGKTADQVATASTNIESKLKPAQDGFTGLGKSIDNADGKLKKVPTSSGQATLALGNLGRVASDAPFGFIAIANNIEPLIQSLQNLGRTSGGLGGTLKALGGSLLGPGGLLLGFSLVSSAITVAVQKYGSLGNAINALFGTQDELVKLTRDAADSYAKFNKELKTTADIQGQAASSVQGEISKVKTLAAIVTDQTKTYNERNSALKALQEINKTYFGDIDEEGVKLGKLTTAVEAYTQATIQAAVTKGFESEIGRVSVELDKQQRVLDKLIPRLGQAAAAQRAQSQALPGLAQAAAQSQLGSAAADATNAYIEQNKVVEDLRKQLTELNAGINTSINRYNGLIAPAQAAAEAQKKKEEADKKAAEAAKKNNAELKRQEELEAKRIARLDARLANAQTLMPVVGIGFKIDEKNLADNFNRLKAAYDDGLKQFGSIGDRILATIPKLPTDFKIIPPQAFTDAAAQAEQLRTKLQETAGTVIEGFNTLIAPAIDSVFNSIQNGTSVIEGLKTSLKGLLIQLAANAAKALILSAALKFIPGAGAVTTGGLFSAGGGLSSGILGSLLGGGGIPRLSGAAAPTFSGNTAFTGGLQLGGQVVFTQRGADLVGVLNSSNARIGRVG